jgi:ribosomal protein S18 acetylase RimI-like enzyme
MTASSLPTVPKGNREAYQLQAAVDVNAAQLARQFEYLTFPSLRQRAQSQTLAAPLHALAATHRGETVGLAIARPADAEASAELISLYVRRDHRGQGLSVRLLTGMERLLSRLGYAKVRLAYRGDWPSAPVVAAILRRRHWTAPEENLLLGKFSIAENAATWSHSRINRVTLPEDFHLISWSELSQAEIAGLQDEGEPSSSADLAPLSEPDRIERRTSVALRHQGRVVGWMITHRLDDQTIQYTRLHVAPQFQRLGRGLPLLAEAIRRQIDAGIPFGVFQVRCDNPRMLQLVRRRLLPFLGTWTSSLISEKRLSPSH